MKGHPVTYDKSVKRRNLNFPICEMDIKGAKEASQGYKVSLGFLECKDLRGRRDHQDKRVILENQDYLEQKGQEVFLAKMAHQAPQVFQDAMAQRAHQDCQDFKVLLGLQDLPDHRVTKGSVGLQGVPGQAQVQEKGDFATKGEKVWIGFIQ
ncbi:hypothetical protein H8959_013932 [Pygathrix nigripes]